MGSVWDSRPFKHLRSFSIHFFILFDYYSFIPLCLLGYYNWVSIVRFLFIHKWSFIFSRCSCCSCYSCSCFSCSCIFSSILLLLTILLVYVLVLLFFCSKWQIHNVHFHSNVTVSKGNAVRPECCVLKRECVENIDSTDWLCCCWNCWVCTTDLCIYSFFFHFLFSFYFLFILYPICSFCVQKASAQHLFIYTFLFLCVFAHNMLG